MCDSCYEYRRKHGLIQVNPHRVKDFIEDVEWMVQTGETHVETIANRLGLGPSALVRRLERHAQTQILVKITGRNANFVRLSNRNHA
jgi:DNA-binding Lrp family transcriptional regulator